MQIINSCFFCTLYATIPSMNINKKEQKLLTIFIPTYKRSKILQEWLNSIFSQNSEALKHIDIVISDDASTDDTEAVVRSYMKKHDNIFYYRNEKNLRFFNTVHISNYIQSKYIVFLADDDCLTSFALPNIIEIIKKTNFDILFHRPDFSEKLDKKPIEKSNTFKIFSWAQEYIKFLYENEKKYKNLICYFSFYSAVIAKTEYWLEALANSDEKLLRTNNFPHEILHYYDLKEKTIVIPDNTFVLWRLLNEWYPGSKVLIGDLKEIMNYVEKQNNLKDLQQRKIIKKICIRWWSRTILLWILIKKLHINYKTNGFLKKIYFLYKKFVQ